MRFGMCVGDNYEQIAKVKEYGYDYAEGCFSLLTEKDDEYLAKFKSELDKNDIELVTVNCFIPGSLPVTGENVDKAALAAYVEKGFRRGVPLGLKKVVFGSSGARSIRPGQTYSEAIRQIADFLKTVVAPLAEKYSITVTVEPLAPQHCNIINTSKEAVILAGYAESDNVCGLVDLYHMEKIGDTYENIKALKGSIRHAHVAEAVSRAFPQKGDGCDYQGFIDALIEAGCDTCSVEADCVNFEEQAKAAAEVLYSLKF